MERPLLDTSVFSTYKKQIDQRIELFYFSTVVLYELIASNIDESTLQKYSAWESVFAKTGQLITPSRTDWVSSARCVRRLRHLKLINKNLSPTSLQNDALIARNSFMHKCFVVTDNVRDYSLLQQVMPKLAVIPANEFFN
jgi:predicted nucleic acid-binding protein